MTALPLAGVWAPAKAAPKRVRAATMAVRGFLALALIGAIAIVVGSIYGAVAFIEHYGAPPPDSIAHLLMLQAVLLAWIILAFVAFIGLAVINRLEAVRDRLDRLVPPAV